MALQIVNPDLDVHNHYRSVPLDELADRIRERLKDAKTSLANALAAALDAGDDLIAAQLRVTDTPWQRWLRANCFLSLSSAKLYMQLARHREEIEAAIEQAGELSLRAARRLIARKPTDDAEAELIEDDEPEPPNPELEPPDPAAVVLAGLQALTDAQLTSVWAEFGFAPLLRTMPADWRTELERRIAGLQRSNKMQPVLLRASECLRQVIGQIRLSTAPETTPAATERAERQALVALWGLATVLPDNIDFITVINRYAKEKRCAKGKGRRAA
jgi:hypothetical protein